MAVLLVCRNARYDIPTCTVGPIESNIRAGVFGYLEALYRRRLLMAHHDQIVR